MRALAQGCEHCFPAPSRTDVSVIGCTVVELFYKLILRALHDHVILHHENGHMFVELSVSNWFCCCLVVLFCSLIVSIWPLLLKFAGFLILCYSGGEEPVVAQLRFTRLFCREDGRECVPNQTAIDEERTRKSQGQCADNAGCLQVQ
jgi:hypothetical protein